MYIYVYIYITKQKKKKIEIKYMLATDQYYLYFIINKYSVSSHDHFYFIFDPNFFVTLQTSYFVVIFQ